MCNLRVSPTVFHVVDFIGWTTEDSNGLLPIETIVYIQLGGNRVMVNSHGNRVSGFTTEYIDSCAVLNGWMYSIRYTGSPLGE